MTKKPLQNPPETSSDQEKEPVKKRSLFKKTLHIVFLPIITVVFFLLGLCQVCEDINRGPTIFALFGSYFVMIVGTMLAFAALYIAYIPLYLIIEKVFILMK